MLSMDAETSCAELGGGFRGADAASRRKCKQDKGLAWPGSSCVTRHRLFSAPQACGGLPGCLPSMSYSRTAANPWPHLRLGHWSYWSSRRRISHNCPEL